MKHKFLERLQFFKKKRTKICFWYSGAESRTASGDTISRINSLNDLSEDVKKNYFNRRFVNSEITSKEIRTVLTQTKYDDSTLRDKSIDILIAYGRKKQIVFETLIEITHEALNMAVLRSLIVILSHIWHHYLNDEARIEYYFELLLELLSRRYDPYKMDQSALFQTANRSLTSILRKKPDFVGKVYTAIAGSKDYQSNYQLANVLAFASTSDINFSTNVLTSLMKYKDRFKNLASVVALFDSKADPKDLAERKTAERLPTSSITFIVKILAFVLIAGLTVIIYTTNPLSSLFSSTEISPGLSISIRQNTFQSIAFIIGIITAFYIFAVTHIAQRYPSNYLISYFRHPWRICLLAILVILALFPLLLPIQACPHREGYFCGLIGILPFFAFAVFAFLLIRLAWHLNPLSMISNYLDSRMGNVRRLAKKEGEISNNMMDYHKRKLSLMHIFSETTPNLARNRFSITARKNGIVARANFELLAEITSILIEHNESKSCTGKPMLASEIGINKMIGTVVQRGEAIATLYAEEARLIHALKQKKLDEKMLVVDYGSYHHNYIDTVNALFRTFVLFFEKSNVEICSYVLDLMVSLIRATIAEKKSVIPSNQDRLNRKTRFVFPLRIEYEAVFMENLILESLFKAVEIIYTNGHHELQMILPNLYRKICSIGDEFAMYAIVEILLVHIHKLDTVFTEKKDYDSLIEIMFSKTKLAETFYDLQEEVYDYNLRNTAIEVSQTLLELSHSSKDCRGRLNEVFFNCEILLRIIVVRRFLYGAKVSDSINEMVRLFNETVVNMPHAHDMRYETLLIMRTIFFVGLQAFVIGRYTIAYNAGIALKRIEAVGSVKFRTFFRYIETHIRQFQMVHSVYANFFIPLALGSNISLFRQFLQGI